MRVAKEPKKTKDIYQPAIQYDTQINFHYFLSAIYN